jgi:hypothetical protein
MPEGELAGHARVGEGREADIFAWDEGTVLRLLRRSSDPTRVEREAAAMRAAGDGGVDAPKVYGTTMVEGRACGPGRDRRCERPVVPTFPPSSPTSR